MILRGQLAYELVGIPRLHAEVFQEVANFTGNVISSRAVGVYATGLIEEGYASKGFHNKAKSCNWGPMAGFVLDDPRFTKVGNSQAGVAGQREALQDALKHHAVEVPVYISDARRKWLLNPPGMLPLIRLIDNDANTYFVRGESAWGLNLLFKLQRARPQGATQDMWAVMYRGADRQSASDRGKESGWKPVLALRDPMCTIPASDYRAATTGDYDLFAVWAGKDAYRPEGMDERRVGRALLEANIRKGKADTGEDKHLGNITARIAIVRHWLNSGFRRRGYTGGNMVHHSDEGGRPFVNDVDLPVFAVVPSRSSVPSADECYALQDIGDLRQFITQELAGDYAPVFSPGWMKQLVFGAGATKGMVDRAALTANAIRFQPLGREIRGFKRPGQP